MRSGIIDMGSTVRDIAGVLTGNWSEFDRGEFHVVKTPFLLSLTAVLDAGSTALPFQFDVPVSGKVTEASGNVVGKVIKPGDTAVELDNPGLFELTVYGIHAATSNLIQGGH